jgi:hypothetical protein
MNAVKQVLAGKVGGLVGSCKWARQLHDLEGCVYKSKGKEYKVLNAMPHVELESIV